MAMTLLIGLTILFVGYILYILISVAITGCPHEQPPAPTGLQKPKAAAAMAEAAVTSQPDQAEAPPTPEEIALVKQFRHPQTGETAAVPNNYRFAKRWIKEALVQEGLLDRIYRNTELQDEVIHRRVKEALDQFKAIRKYWA